MSKYGYEVSTPPAYLEIHRYKMRQRRKKYLLISTLGILLMIVLYTNRRAIQGNYRKIILGSISFEAVDQMFKRDDSPILVIHPDGKRVDTITNTETYKALFFSPNMVVEDIIRVGGDSIIANSTKLDPLVDLSTAEEEEQAEEVLQDPLKDLSSESDPLEVYIDDGQLVQAQKKENNPISTESSASETNEVNIQSTESNTDRNPPTFRVKSEIDRSSQPPVRNERTLPGFPGGLRALTRYIKENMNYPEDAERNQVEGVVYISFMINRKGEVENPVVFKGLGYGCNEEAIRLVSNMPRWIPGSKEGLPADMSYTLPVTFKLN